jgi:hypothetical protein
VEVSDYSTCERTYATLRIYPKSLDPSDVTARLGIEPSHWQRRGESRKLGDPLVKLHGWFLTSEGAVESHDVRRHLDWLLLHLVPRTDAVLALQADGCRMDVSCYWLSASGHGGPSVRPAQMGEFARLGLELWFDVYFQADRTANQPRHLHSGE